MTERVGWTKAAYVANMIVYTGQVSKWRAIAATGIQLLDTTVKTGTSVFRPTWQMVLDVKSGAITEAKYTTLYYAKMRQCVRDYPMAWVELTSCTKFHTTIKTIITIKVTIIPVGLLKIRHLSVRQHSQTILLLGGIGFFIYFL